MREKAFAGAVALVIIGMLVVHFYGGSTIGFDNSGSIEGEINVTLLTNAGVLIEADDTRIYIDPVVLPNSYSESPADAILVTHSHGDHYQSSTINMLQKDGPINVFPEIMTAETDAHDGVGVTPGDEFMVGNIKVSTYYMYTFSVVPGQDATHPLESEFTSYIVDVGGFTIFHAGDSKNLSEYEEISGTSSTCQLTRTHRLS